MASYKYKSRKQKEIEYFQKYGDVPDDYAERIDYLIQKNNLSYQDLQNILAIRSNMINNLYYIKLKVVVFYEVPMGTGRPRSSIVTATNYHKEAQKNPYYVHVYSPGAADDQLYMKRLIKDELIVIDRLIYTPVNIQYNAYYPTPSYYTPYEQMLAECGVICPSCDKPDYDNVEKKYSDMYNYNVWVDDAVVNRSLINKFYSMKPRLEVYLSYLNTLYNRHQYSKMIKRKAYDGLPLSYLNSRGEIVNV